jgi:hypothetical protein
VIIKDAITACSVIVTSVGWRSLGCGSFTHWNVCASVVWRSFGCGSLANLDPTLYAMQMQNPDVLTHAQIKKQIDVNTFIEAQRPEIKRLIDFELIPRTNQPA